MTAQQGGAKLRGGVVSICSLTATSFNFMFYFLL